MSPCPLVCRTVACGLWFCAMPAVAELSCHLHAPADVAPSTVPARPEDIPAVSAMPVFSTTLACDAANALYHLGQGRCHCRFDAGEVGGLIAPPPIEPSGPRPLP